jgi:hypothetical protein
LNIEKQYSDFFENRESKFKELEPHDRLHNHWILFQENDLIKFGFEYKSDLPEYIRKECIKVFEKVFG